MDRNDAPPAHDQITLDYIEETIQASDNPQVEALFGDLGFITSNHIQEANRAIQDELDPYHWLTASIDVTLVEVDPGEGGSDDEIALDYIEETIQAAENKNVEMIIGDLGFIVSEHVQEINRAVREILGTRHWITASLDTTLVKVQVNNDIVRP